MAAIIGVGLWTRFFNFEPRITFGPEQAMSLIISRQLSDKPSLLGQPYFRVTSTGHQLFAGPVFNYLLLGFIKIFGTDIFTLTKVFAGINIATALLLYGMARKRVGESVALISVLLFVFDRYMINHSLFVWILNFLPAIGIATLFYSWDYFKKPTLVLAAVLGVLSGLGFQLEYFYIFSAALVFVYLFFRSSSKVTHSLAFTAGGLIGILPMALFEIRHGFYLTKALWQYLLDTLQNTGQSQITYYHFLHFVPVVIVVAAFIIVRLAQKGKWLAAVALAGLYIFLSLSSGYVSFSRPTGMPDGLNAADLVVLSDRVAAESPRNFNIASLLDFDTRFHTLRYLLAVRHNIYPLGITQYSDPDVLYVLASGADQVARQANYELRSFSARTISEISSVGDGYFLYKLTK